jgi:hypothetical protein
VTTAATIATSACSLGRPVTLPAIALVYTTDAENRLADNPELDREMAIVRQKLRPSRQSECSRRST